MIAESYCKKRDKNNQILESLQSAEKNQKSQEPKVPRIYASLGLPAEGKKYTLDGLHETFENSLKHVAIAQLNEVNF